MIDAGSGFAALFGRAPDVTAEAPGRVNLMGEHTDYNGGYVLPIATPQTTMVELGPRRDRRVRVWSAAIGAEPLEYVLGEEVRRGAWIDYVQGVTRVLADEGFALAGFDLRITSSVPLGSGLSSSAALEVSLARGLRDLFGLPLDDVRIAVVGRRAENEFVGAPVGIMDQMAASLASTWAALFLNTRTLAYEIVPLPVDIELVVIDSGIKHEHAGGDYRLRKAECERAAALLGVEQLCDLGEDADDRIRALPEPLDRRVRHVLSENARVPAAVAAMRRGDLDGLGSLFRASHVSMRDDYEVSTPEIDTLVEFAHGEADVFGARLTGGGFGGSVVMIARRGSGAAAGARIARAYAEQTGQTPAVLLPDGRGALSHSS
ncbi:galactokinase [Polyangium sp. y55x31]|uniref:galactokinase n=1 Tax=Polyangium sp. y55x31 TaxID=3042688 RepID=UPI0024821361|nr:galactokinase [Polyangium sp. y55x31]MDI1475910.1 galactokinase [Polyangium sp. y55x31]